MHVYLQDWNPRWDSIIYLEFRKHQVFQDPSTSKSWWKMRWNQSSKMLLCFSCPDISRLTSLAHRKAHMPGHESRCGCGQHRGGGAAAGMFPVGLYAWANVGFLAPQVLRERGILVANAQDANAVAVAECLGRSCQWMRWDEKWHRCHSTLVMIQIFQRPFLMSKAIMELSSEAHFCTSSESGPALVWPGYQGLDLCPSVEF